MSRITSTRALVAGAASVAAMVGSAVLVAPNAYAACSWSGAKTSTSTTIYAGSCQQVQARIDRYRYNYPTAYYGNWDSTKSSVTQSAGVDSGHAGHARNADGSYVQPWVWF